MNGEWEKKGVDIDMAEIKKVPWARVDFKCGDCKGIFVLTEEDGSKVKFKKASYDGDFSYGPSFVFDCPCCGLQKEVECKELDGDIEDVIKI